MCCDIGERSARVNLSRLRLPRAKTMRSALILLLAALLWACQPASEPSEDHSIVARIEKADLIADAHERCLAYPSPIGVHWSQELIAALCADQFTPRLSWEVFQDKVEDMKAKEIDAQLDAILAAYYAGEVPEGALRLAYYANFDYSAAVVESMIDSWLHQSPDSAHALVARGIHRVARAQGFRGERFYRDTPIEAIDKMAREAELARTDLERALAQNPRIWPAYEALVDVARFSGDTDLGADALRGALKVDPKNYYVRERYAAMLEPRWGGSWEQMDRVASDAAPYLDRNPRLVLLRTLALASRGWPPYHAKDFLRALELYERGIVEGPVWENLLTGGTSALRSGKHIRAVELYSQILRFWPRDQDARYWRAESFKAMELDEMALADYQQILAANPGNVFAQRAYAQLLLKRDDYDAAERKLAALHAANPSDLWVAERLAWVYVYRRPQYAEAAVLIDQLLAADPKSGAAWLMRADLIQFSKGEGLQEALENFVRYADLTNSEQRQALPKVKASLQRQSSRPAGS